jgi:hypothetical protein
MSSACGSRASISPQSSLQESFTQSPAQTSPAAIVAHTGQEFPPFPTSRQHISPPGFFLEAQLPDPAPPEDFDLEFLNFVDMDQEPWNSKVATVNSNNYNHGHSLNHYDPWTNFQPSERDPFAPGDFTSISTSYPGQLLSETNFASLFPGGMESQAPQRHSEQSTSHAHPLEDATYQSVLPEFDIDQLLLPYASEGTEIPSMRGYFADVDFYSSHELSSGSAIQRSTGAREAPSAQYTDYVLYPESIQSRLASESGLSPRPYAPGHSLLHGGFSTVTTPLISDINVPGYLQETLGTLQTTPVTPDDPESQHESLLPNHDIHNSLFENQNMDGDQGGGGSKGREKGNHSLPDSRVSERQCTHETSPDSTGDYLDICWRECCHGLALPDSGGNQPPAPDTSSGTSNEFIPGRDMRSSNCSSCSATFNTVDFYDHVGCCRRTAKKGNIEIPSNSFHRHVKTLMFSINIG